MGGWPRPANALVLCCCIALAPWARHSSHRGGGGGREEKVPMTVVVPDYAPVPVPGSDGGDDEDGTPRLPSERRSTGAASSADHHSASHAQAAQAPAAGEATRADFISSSPAGVTDSSATVLPMPTPAGHHQLRDDVGMGTLRLQVTAVQLAVPLLMIAVFWGYLCLCGRSCSVL